MRYVWLVFAGLLVAMAIVLPRLNRRADAPKRATWTTTKSDELPAQPVSTSFAALREPPVTGLAARADSIVAFGLSHQGTPYVFAGTSPITGFDCSGFIMYTFAHFGVAVPHSTALLIDVGRPVARAEAQPGDIVVFTGTAPTSLTPGHAGIVISRRGEVPLRFVHASSARRESGVKVSQVEGTDYERRFMQVRRVLGVGALAATPQAAPPHAVVKGPSVAALPARPIEVEPELGAPTAPPKILVPLKKTSISTSLRPSSVKRKAHAVAKKTAPKKVVATKKASTKTPAKPTARPKAPVKKTTHAKARK